jgi:hypothetical protein
MLIAFYQLEEANTCIAGLSDPMTDPLRTNNTKFLHTLSLALVC